MPYRQGKNRRELTRMKYFLRRYLIYIVVLVVLLVGLIATMRIYDRSAENEVLAEGSAAKYVQAETNNLAMYEPDSFNAISSTDEDTIYLNQIIFGYLFKLNDSLNIEPDIVNSYSTNPDEGTVRVNIRSDAIFSNGLPVTSSDVERTIAAIKDAGKNSPYYEYVNKIERVSVEGEKDLVIKFASPAEAALDNLVFPILSRESYKKGEQFSIGCGPYAYSTYDRGKGLKLVPNEYYFGNASGVPIEIIFVNDKSAIPGMVTMDAVTGFLSKDQNSDNIANDKGLRCISVVSSELEYLGFNCQNELLSDNNMRRAIAMAIDRDQVIADDYGSDAVISDSLYYPGFLGTDRDDGFKYEPKSSTDIITGMGLRDVDEDGIMETESGDDVRFTLIVDSSNSSRADAANSIAEDLEALGIGIDVRALSSAEFKSALNSGNFDLYLAGIKFDKQFKMTELYDTYNYGKYAGTEVISLTRELERAHTSEEQRSIFRDLKSKLDEEMPYFGLCYKKYFFISGNTLVINETPQFFNPYRGIETWSWKNGYFKTDKQ